jgi:hypothetical protein
MEKNAVPTAGELDKIKKDVDRRQNNDFNPNMETIYTIIFFEVS